MKLLVALLAILVPLSGPLRAQETHPHRHSEKTKDSHTRQATPSNEDHESHDEHGSSHAEEGKETGADGHDDHAEDHGHDDHGDEKGGHVGEAHEEGHEEGEEEEFSSSVGPGNAVTAADREKGIQLSAEAVATLGIKTQPRPSGGSFPKQAIVYFKDETGVYRLRDGWYKLVEGEARPEAGGRARFAPNRAADLRAGDHVVIDGVPLLRVTELDAFSGGEAGHGH